MSQSFVTTNADDPENVLEALLQVVVCEKDIGWRDRNSMAMDPKERGLNRVVLVMTDDQFHFAGEGKVRGREGREGEIYVYICTVHVYILHW